MKTIFKYPLLTEDSQLISIPEGAKFLSVLEQYGSPVAYFLVNPNQEKFPIEFRILGTGQLIEENYLEDFFYLGTISTRSGQLIWHIFAEKTSAWTKRF